MEAKDINRITDKVWSMIINKFKSDLPDDWGSQLTKEWVGEYIKDGIFDPSEIFKSILSDYDTN
jgi:hypothetical protein